MTSGTDGAPKPSKKPRYSRFTQQELPACKPILTPALIMASFISLGITFIPIGVSHLSASEQVVEIIDRYDGECIKLNHTVETATSHLERAQYVQDETTDKTCIRVVNASHKMKPPIFVYYQLDDFYQNHRRYVKSRSDKQYRSPKNEYETGDCDPEAMVNNKPIVPCGLIAWSLFNDTYKITINDVPIPINKKGIAWESDKTHKFGSDVYPKNFQASGLIGGAKLDERIPLSEQEDLLVWMRTAALPTFRKLYGRIETEIEAKQNITVEIQNNYNTYSFQGQKRLVLSTTSWIGGKNNFLGEVYIIVGGLCLFLAIAFIIVYLIRPRPLGDPSYLSWNKNPSSL